MRLGRLPIHGSRDIDWLASLNRNDSSNRLSVPGDDDRVAGLGILGQAGNAAGACFRHGDVFRDG